MTQELQIESVRRTITVPIAPERAFTLFTERMHAWWPPTHSITEAPFETAVIEPRAGGRWYERAQDGAEADWGRVLAYEPPHRVLLSWHLRSDYSYDPDPAHASEIEVRFVPDGDGTRVELEHGQFANHGEGGLEIHDSVGSENGWSGILALFAKAA